MNRPLKLSAVALPCHVCTGPAWRGEVGDVAGAIAEFEQLLTDRSRVLGADHPNTLLTRNNLAYWQDK